MTKTCFKCRTKKSLAEFYRHPLMADGHLGKCKDCTRRDVSANYRKNREHYREYDRKRLRTSERKTAMAEYCRRARRRYPERERAHRAVSYALRTGKLKRKHCEVCRSRHVHAHHDDYSKPLDVRWLCPLHHRKLSI